jgi:hypothetical protein
VIGCYQNGLVGLYIFPVFDKNITEYHPVLPGHDREEECVEEAAFANVADFHSSKIKLRAFPEAGARSLRALPTVEQISEATQYAALLFPWAYAIGNDFGGEAADG